MIPLGAVLVLSTPLANTAMAAGKTTLPPTPGIPPSVRAEVATVHTVADLARVSPAARAAIETVTGEFDVTTTNAPPGLLTGPAAQHMLTAVANGRPVMMNGWKPIWPPGCYWVENTHSWTNAFGWVLITGGWHVNNWCFTGSAIQYTPNAYSIINTHWGWGWCGFVGNPYTDWVSQWWGWQASGTFSFSLDPTCRIADRHDIGTQVWGNGHENWWP